MDTDAGLVSMAERQRLMDHVIGAAVGLLAAAVAIYVAVHLIEAIWPALLVILAAALLASALTALWRTHRSRW